MDAVFWELHSGLAREGPGSDADTRQALALTELSGALQILDAGCGPGPASLVLLNALPLAQVTAIDLHQPFLDALEESANAAGHADRLTTVAADMASLPSSPGTLDLIWCEAAIYNLGAGNALKAWAPYLAPRGQVVFSELIWSTSDPHQEAKDFWRDEYPGMQGFSGVCAVIEQAGFRLVADRTLSDAGWAAYYDPLESKGATLAKTYGDDHPALIENRREIEMRRRYGTDFEYHFFVVTQ